jgi:hypothetical protein
MLASWNGTGWETQRFAKCTDYYLTVNADGKAQEIEPAQWNWQNVYDGKRGYPFFIMDSSGNPHISYFQDNSLWYARWTGNDSKGWEVKLVESLTDVGEYNRFGGYVSMALDKNDNPHIAYITHISWEIFDDEDSLKYASWNGSEWTIQVVYQTLFGNSSAPSTYDPMNLVLDSNDNPSISYLTSPSFTSNLMYSSWNGNNWNTQFISECTGKSSLAVDSQNIPHLCFYSGGEKGQVLRYASPKDSSWDIQTVDDTEFMMDNDIRGYYFTGPSLVFDRNGYAHVSYGGDLILKYATLAPVSLTNLPNNTLIAIAATVAIIIAVVAISTFYLKRTRDISNQSTTIPNGGKSTVTD